MKRGMRQTVGVAWLCAFVCASVWDVVCDCWLTRQVSAHSVTMPLTTLARALWAWTLSLELNIPMVTSHHTVPCRVVFRAKLTTRCLQRVNAGCLARPRTRHHLHRWGMPSHAQRVSQPPQRHHPRPFPPMAMPFAPASACWQHRWPRVTCAILVHSAS